MNPVFARASFCLAIFIILFVNFFAAATHDPRTFVALNHAGVSR